MVFFLSAGFIRSGLYPTKKSLLKNKHLKKLKNIKHKNYIPNPLKNQNKATKQELREKLKKPTQTYNNHYEVHKNCGPQEVRFGLQEAGFGSQEAQMNRLEAGCLNSPQDKVENKYTILK